MGIFFLKKISVIKFTLCTTWQICMKQQWMLLSIVVFDKLLLNKLLPLWQEINEEIREIDEQSLNSKKNTMIGWWKAQKPPDHVWTEHSRDKNGHLKVNERLRWYGKEDVMADDDNGLQGNL